MGVEEGIGKGADEERVEEWREEVMVRMKR